MIKKIFTMCLTAIFIFHGAVFAKSEKKSVGIPIEDRIKISVDITDHTSFLELDTEKFLCSALVEEISKKNIFNILPEELANVEKFSLTKSLGEKQTASDVGELLIFNPAETDNSKKISESDKNFYKELGADYLIQCKIIGLGTTLKKYDGLGFNPGIGLGRHGRLGIGIFSSINSTFKRTFYCTVVNVKFIKTDTQTVLWQKNFIGQAARHHKPRKGYDDATDEAYLESIQSAAEDITENVARYSRKFILKKKSEKS